MPPCLKRLFVSLVFLMLTALFTSWKVNDHLSLSAELSHLNTGNYYAHREDGNWVQLQAVWTF